MIVLLEQALSAPVDPGSSHLNWFALSQFCPRILADSRFGARQGDRRFRFGQPASCLQTGASVSLTGPQLSILLKGPTGCGSNAATSRRRRRESAGVVRGSA